MIKIIFDNIIYTLQKSGGISVVWSEYLSRMLSNSFLSMRFIDYNKGSANIFRNKLNINVDYLYKKNMKTNFILRYINPVVISDSKFIFHSSYYRYSSNKHAINITTVHDFTYESFANTLKARIHSWQKNKAIRNSKYIICVSENTKRDLLRLLPDIDEHKVRVVYNGVSDDYFPLSMHNYNLPFVPYTYVLFVGSRSHYKKFDLALDAVALSKYNFLIVGPPLSNNEKNKISNKMPSYRFKYVGNIPNYELNILYNNAFSLLYPSEYEGFGIPVIEAQKAGCPVIAYNSSSIPEVIGETPLLIEKLSIESILNCFNMLEQHELRTEIIRNGINNAKRFTWDRMYKEILDIYKEAWSLTK
jgi:glycosyltransferase involved in cell wall biosynthesis